MRVNSRVLCLFRLVPAPKHPSTGLETFDEMGYRWLELKHWYSNDMVLYCWIVVETIYGHTYFSIPIFESINQHINQWLLLLWSILRGRSHAHHWVPGMICTNKVAVTKVFRIQSKFRFQYHWGMFLATDCASFLTGVRNLKLNPLSSFLQTIRQIPVKRGRELVLPS